MLVHNAKLRAEDLRVAHVSKGPQAEALTVSVNVEGQTNRVNTSTACS